MSSELEDRREWNTAVGTLSHGGRRIIHGGCRRVLGVYRITEEKGKRRGKKRSRGGQGRQTPI